VRRPLVFLFGLVAASTILVVSVTYALEADYLLAAYVLAFSLGAFMVLFNRFVKEKTPRYPQAFPGERDAYFPRTDIPRPIHDDVRNYPEYFKRVKEKKPEES